MLLTRTEITYGRKFNLGDYNQLHVEVSLEVVFEEGDVVEEVFESARELVREQVKAEAMRVMRQNGAVPSDRVIPDEETFQ